MTKLKMKKGLDIPLSGNPKQLIDQEKKNVKKIALLGEDYIGLKPTMKVKINSKVKLGEILFTDKQNPKVKYTSPACGKIIEINRGEKRALISVVIELNGNDEIQFDYFKQEKLKSIKKEEIINILIESGLWTSIRVRPYDKVANPLDNPNTIFVTAMDTNPLAPSVEKIVEEKKLYFENGLIALSKLTKGIIFVCKSPEENIPGENIPGVLIKKFEGPHPAGLVGTHIHYLDTVNRNKKVWHINAQDLISIGQLIISGKINVERIISLAGSLVNKARLIKTRIGANIDEITHGELNSEKDVRKISGSVLSGRLAKNSRSYLGRYHQSISVIPEAKNPEFLGWLKLGLNRFSFKRTTLSKLIPGKKFNINTSVNGGLRAIVPIGVYEEVIPLDILATFLLRAIAIKDVEEAEKLGCLELVEEDLSLCTFVCPSKINHGSLLRETLNILEKEG